MTRTAAQLTAGAAAWAAALVVAAFVAPVYDSDTSGATAGDASDTLVGVNGPGIALAVAVPVAVLLALAVRRA